MNASAEAADQIVRMSLNGVEVAAKIINLSKELEDTELKEVEIKDTFTAEELAEMTGTINYEIICQFQKRVTIVQHK